jgi:hypothetical protein
MQYINTTLNPIVAIPNDWKDLTGDITQNQALMQQLTDLINKQLYYSDVNSIAQALDSVVGANGELYIGNPSVDGNWMISKDDGDLIIAKRENGAWVIKQTING